jgi:toxin ParE1/3/4
LKHYLLTAKAESDLRNIIQYTRSEWGNTQTRRYIEKLEQGIVSLIEGKHGSKDMDDLYPKLRMKKCEHHYIFCLPRDHQPSLIIAIFHERMDLMKRLSDRLGGGYP